MAATGLQPKYERTTIVNTVQSQPAQSHPASHPAQSYPAMRRRLQHAGVAVACIAGAVGIFGAAAIAGDQPSAWVDGFNNKARLHTGTGPDTKAVYAGLEITMPESWKTYWRFPGEAGGIPPEIDVSKSENLKAAKLLFPAPRRLADKSGDVLGYKSTVTFPIALTAIDASKPITLRLTANYGVCNDICVPAEAAFEVTIPPDAAVSPGIAAALARVPQPKPEGAPTTPALAGWRIVGEGAAAELRLDVRAEGDADAVDVFVDAADGSYVPMTRKTATGDGTFVFTLPLREGEAAADLHGKPLTVTLTSAAGHAETIITIKR